MAGPGDEEHLGTPLSNNPVQVRVEESQPWDRTEVAEQPGLDVCLSERTAKQRVIAQIDLPDAQVVRRSPPRIEVGEGIRAALLSDRRQSSTARHRLSRRRRQAPAQAR